MNKYELIREFKRQRLPELSYKDCREIVEGVLAVMEDGLMNTGELKIVDFLSIKVVPSHWRRRTLPNGKEVNIGERQRLKISPGKKLKRILNESRCTLA